MAVEIKEGLPLTDLFLVPSARPPHKPSRPMALAEDRLAMVSAAVAGIEGISVLDLELRREGPSYSLHTVREVSEGNPGAELLFLIGADAFAEISTWHRYRDLLAMCDFLLLPRPGISPEASFPPGILIEPEGNRCYNLPGCSYRLPGGRRLLFPVLPVLDISSRSIREKVRRGDRSGGWCRPRSSGTSRTTSCTVGKKEGSRSSPRGTHCFDAPASHGRRRVSTSSPSMSGSTPASPTTFSSARGVPTGRSRPFRGTSRKR